MKIRDKYTLTVVVALLVAVVGHAADTESDSWSVLNIYGNASQNFDATLAGVTFPDLGDYFNPGAERQLIPGTSDARSAFSGDLAAAGVHSLSFDITCTGLLPDSACRLELRANGGIWFKTGILPAEAGGSVSHTIPLGRVAGGWDTYSFAAGAKDAAWTQALTSVDSFRVLLRRSSENAEHTVTVDNFKLSGEHVVAASEYASPFLYALRETFGRQDIYGIEDLTEQEKALDSDGDGMNDWAEVLADFDEGAYAATLFAAEIVSVGNDSVTLKWPAIADQSYSVWSAPTPGGPWTLVQGGITETETGPVVRDIVTTTDGPKFFKVLKY